MRALLVVNPEATTTSAAGRRVLARALASQVKLELVETRYRGHAEREATRAMREGYDFVVVHGGDGTVNEVVNGLLVDGAGRGRAAPALGVVPGGAANVFARALGIEHEPLEATHQLLTAIEDGTGRWVGLGQVDNRWFIFNAGLGIDADAVQLVERYRSRGTNVTPWVYAKAAIAAWLAVQGRAPRLTVELPDGHTETDIRLVMLSKTDPWTYFGTRAIRPNPSCSFDGGLGIFALHRLGPATVTRAAVRLWRGTHRPHRHVVRDDDVAAITVRSDRPVSMQLDGDYQGKRTEARFSARPSAVRVLL